MPRVSGEVRVLDARGNGNVEGRGGVADSDRPLQGPFRFVVRSREGPPAVIGRNGRLTFSSLVDHSELTVYYECAYDHVSSLPVRVPGRRLGGEAGAIILVFPSEDLSDDSSPSSTADELDVDVFGSDVEAALKVPTRIERFLAGPPKKKHKPGTVAKPPARPKGLKATQFSPQLTHNTPQDWHPAGDPHFAKVQTAADVDTMIQQATLHQDHRDNIGAIAKAIYVNHKTKTWALYDKQLVSDAMEDAIQKACKAGGCDADEKLAELQDKLAHQAMDEFKNPLAAAAGAKKKVSYGQSYDRSTEYYKQAKNTLVPYALKKAYKLAGTSSGLDLNSLLAGIRGRNEDWHSKHFSDVEKDNKGTNFDLIVGFSVVQRIVRPGPGTTDTAATIDEWNKHAHQKSWITKKNNNKWHQVKPTPIDTALRREDLVFTHRKQTNYGNEGNLPGKGKTTGQYWGGGIFQRHIHRSVEQCSVCIYFHKLHHAQIRTHRNPTRTERANSKRN